MRSVLASMVVAPLLLAPARAGACVCLPPPAAVIFPDHRSPAPPNTHVWMRLNQVFVASALCPDKFTRDEDLLQPPPCPREPRFVLRRAYTTGEGEEAPIPVRTRKVVSGALVVLEIVPEAELRAGDFYEVWWEEEDRVVEPRVLTVFHVAGEPDRKPPSWSGSRLVEIRAPGEENSFSSCGDPVRVMTFYGPHASDEVDSFRLLYAAWFSAGPQPDDRRAPDVLWFGPELMGSDPAKAIPSNLIGAPMQIVEQRTTTSYAECMEHDGRIPREPRLQVGLKAIDLSGNATPLMLLSADQPKPQPQPKPKKRKR